MSRFPALLKMGLRGSPLFFVPNCLTFRVSNRCPKGDALAALAFLSFTSELLIPCYRGRPPIGSDRWSPALCCTAI